MKTSVKKYSTFEALKKTPAPVKQRAGAGYIDFLVQLSQKNPKHTNTQTGAAGKH